MPKRWQPGHYVQAFDQASRTTFVQGERALVSANPYFKGYQIAVWWDQIEPAQGQYDFSAPLAALANAQSDGKYCWIRLIDRAFQGFTFGRPFPLYLDNAPYGWFQDYAPGAQNIVAPRVWEPATGERWLLAWEALIDACDSHPACQGFTTEEFAIQGAWNVAGYTEVALENFWKEAGRRGAARASNSLIHINSGYGTTADVTRLKPITDYLVTQGCGLGPTDLLRTYIGPGAPQPTLSTDFGRYIFEPPPTGHRDEAFFKTSYEWGSYDGTDTPAGLIDWAYDTLRCHFITWDPDRSNPSATGNSFSTVLAAVNASQGKIWSTKPSRIAAFDTEDPGGGGAVLTPQPAAPLVGAWFAKLTSGADTWSTQSVTASSLSWTTSNVAAGVVGVAYSATLLATGTGTITYSVQTGTLPTGLALSGSTGAITGTPTAGGASEVTFRASNGTTTVDLVVTMTVVAAPAITTTTLAGATRGIGYVQQIVATGTAPLSWSIEGGALPLGLTLDTTSGLVTGTPARAETVNFVVRAGNGAGASTSALVITVADAEVPGEPVRPVDGQWTRLPRDAEIWVRVPRDT